MRGPPQQQPQQHDYQQQQQHQQQQQQQRPEMMMMYDANRGRPNPSSIGLSSSSSLSSSAATTSRMAIMAELRQEQQQQQHQMGPSSYRSPVVGRYSNYDSSGGGGGGYAGGGGGAPNQLAATTTQPPNDRYNIRPETTRPRQYPPYQQQQQQMKFMGRPNAPGGPTVRPMPWGTNNINNNNNNDINNIGGGMNQGRVNFRQIMDQQEQQQQRQRQQQQQQQKQLEEEEQETLRLVEQAQEEELLQLAMARSMQDFQGSSSSSVNMPPSTAATSQSTTSSNSSHVSVTDEDLPSTTPDFYENTHNNNSNDMPTRIPQQQLQSNLNRRSEQTIVETPSLSNNYDEDGLSAEEREQINRAMRESVAELQRQEKQQQQQQGLSSGGTTTIASSSSSLDDVQAHRNRLASSPAAMMEHMEALSPLRRTHDTPRARNPRSPLGQQQQQQSRGGGGGGGLGEIQAQMSRMMMMRDDYGEGPHRRGPPFAVDDLPHQQMGTRVAAAAGRGNMMMTMNEMNRFGAASHYDHDRGGGRNNFTSTNSSSSNMLSTDGRGGAARSWNDLQQLEQQQQRMRHGLDYSDLEELQFQMKNSNSKLHGGRDYDGLPQQQRRRSTPQMNPSSNNDDYHYYGSPQQGRSSTSMHTALMDGGWQAGRGGHGPSSRGLEDLQAQQMGHLAGVGASFSSISPTTTTKDGRGRLMDMPVPAQTIRKHADNNSPRDYNYSNNSNKDDNDKEHNNSNSGRGGPLSRGLTDLQLAQILSKHAAAIGRMMPTPTSTPRPDWRTNDRGPLPSREFPSSSSPLQSPKKNEDDAGAATNDQRQGRPTETTTTTMRQQAGDVDLGSGADHRVGGGSNDKNDSNNNTRTDAWANDAGNEPGKQHESDDSAATGLGGNHVEQYQYFQAKLGGARAVQGADARYLQNQRLPAAAGRSGDIEFTGSEHRSPSGHLAAVRETDYEDEGQDGLPDETHSPRKENDGSAMWDEDDNQGGAGNNNKDDNRNGTREKDSEASWAHVNVNRVEGSEDYANDRMTTTASSQKLDTEVGGKGSEFNDTARMATETNESGNNVDVDDMVAIERALREADEEAEQQSIKRALELMAEDEQQLDQQRQQRQRMQQQGNVRTMTRGEYEAQQRAPPHPRVGAFYCLNPPREESQLDPLSGRQQQRGGAGGGRGGGDSRLSKPSSAPVPASLAALERNAMGPSSSSTAVPPSLAARERGAMGPSSNVPASLAALERGAMDSAAKARAAAGSAGVPVPARLAAMERTTIVPPAAKARANAGSPPLPSRLSMQRDFDDESSCSSFASGFRMNSQQQEPHEWARRDQNTIVGPNNEIRTKHDVQLQAQANAHRLGLSATASGPNPDGSSPSIMHQQQRSQLPPIGNAAFNSFHRAMSRQQKKGVAMHGTGRAGSDSDATMSGVMDPAVRIQISKAINSSLIDGCNGIVKEGKEAVIYHADRGRLSEGFDVAIKVFKRIQEFRSRADYVDGDPRYAGTPFRNVNDREQIQMWAQKEYRNLIRANRAGVPVPTPLLQKENLLFMRFLGVEGWPAPQLREVDLRRGSKRWETIYSQVMEAIERLYKEAQLVHGDLSEYNIMVVPAFLVENKADDIENEIGEVQAVLIDFAQAVDCRHPQAMDLLYRDLVRVQTFFSKQGVHTIGTDEAMAIIMEDDDNDDVDGNNNNNPNNTRSNNNSPMKEHQSLPQDALPPQNGGDAPMR